MDSISNTQQWSDLRNHVQSIEETHLKDLLKDKARCQSLIKEVAGVYVDFCRQRVTQETMRLLLELAKEAKLKEKIEQMFTGQKINGTESRAVLHVATRARRDDVIEVDGKNVVPDVWHVLDNIKSFSEKVRNGEWVGVTGKPLKNVVAVGIGGSFLGPLFVHEALRFDSTEGQKSSAGRQLRFLANVDPIDVANALFGLDQEETLVVIVSKTFTTTETMLNARTVRRWLTAKLGPDCVSKHMVAVSTNKTLVEQFGIDSKNMFGFWDWVGGRYSVCSAVGMLPLSLQYGYDVMEQFLAGANEMDRHFREAPFEDNIPVLMGLFGLWHSSFLGYPARAVLPYCQALSKFAPHIQQVSMESNGKGVDINGNRLPFNAGEIEFGEPGTNGQHSFYQLIHQGRVIPAEFIGIVRSQQSVYLKDEIVSNHDELMCNFFAQQDALAVGKNPVELRAEGVPDKQIPHKTFTGNRPSLSICLPELTAYTVGQLLSIYEHRIAVQGFVWGINSFDQFGVELGKVLASRIRVKINAARNDGQVFSEDSGLNYSTTQLMNNYLKRKTKLVYPEPRDLFPVNILQAELNTDVTNIDVGECLDGDIDDECTV